MSNSIYSPVRENKSARIKLSILQATNTLIGKNSFDKVHVNQICEIVGISKVTFFKYFPQKEDILLYYLRVWCFHRCVELSEEPKRGVNGVRFLFEKIAQTYEQNPGMLLGLISYLGRLDMPFRPYPLKLAERELLYPQYENIGEIDMLSMDQMMENFLLEAILDKEITGTSNTKQLVEMFDSVLYGTILTAHVRQVEFPSILFKTNVNNLLEAQGQGIMTLI
jgi:AcrR family transcriptional regulator